MELDNSMKVAGDDLLNFFHFLSVVPYHPTQLVFLIFVFGIDDRFYQKRVHFANFHHEWRPRNTKGGTGVGEDIQVDTGAV